MKRTLLAIAVFIWASLVQIACGTELSSEWLETMPENSRMLARWAEAERQSGRTNDATRIYRYLIDDEDPKVRNWAAFWLGVLDTTSKIHFPEDAEWGLFFRALRMEDINPAQSVLDYGALQNDTVSQAVKLFASYRSGVLFQSFGKTDTAAQIYARNLERFPKSFLAGEIKFRLGNINFNERNYAQASQFFSQAIDIYRNSIQKEKQWWADEAYFLNAVALLKIGKLDSAKIMSKALSEEITDNRYFTSLTMLIRAYEDKSEAKGKTQLPSTFRADLLMKAGWEAMAAKNYTEAMFNFLEANSAFKNDDAVLFAAECAYNSKEYFKADSLYALVKDTTVQKYAWWGRGWANSKQGKLTLARVFWSKLLTDSLFAEKAYYEVGKTLYFDRDFDSAQIIFSDYIKTFSTRRADAYFYLFVSRLDGGDTARALETAEFFLDKFPKNPKSGLMAYSAARAMFARNRYDNVIQWADQYALNSTVADPLFADSLVLLGERARFLSGEYKEPIDILNNFMTKRPRSSMGTALALGLGSEFEGKSMWQDAIYVYTKAAESALPGDSNWCNAKLGTIRAALSVGDTVKALAEYRIFQIDAEEPYKSQGTIILANHVGKNGDSQRSVELLNDIIFYSRSETAKDSAIVSLARIYMAKQMYSEAITILSKRWSEIPKSNPNLKAFAKLFARSIWELGDADSAYSFSVRYADSAPNACDLLVEMAELAYSENRITIAGKLVDKILAKNCSSVPADFYYRMGEMFIQLERINDACKLWQRALDSKPDDITAQAAREKIQIYTSQGNRP